MLCAAHLVLSATLKQNTRNSLQIRQIRQSPSGALSNYEKQTSTLHVFVQSKNNATEASYRIAHWIAKHGKPFKDRDYIKDAFLSSAEALFDGLPNIETIKSRIRDIPVSARTVHRRIEEMAENVSEQRIAGLKDAMVFSVALDESVDINDVTRLAVTGKIL